MGNKEFELVFLRLAEARVVAPAINGENRRYRQRAIHVEDNSGQHLGNIIQRQVLTIND